MKNRKKIREKGHALSFVLLGLSLMGYSLYSHQQLNIDWVLSPYLFPLILSFAFIGLASAFLYQQFYGKREEPIKKEEVLVDEKVGTGKAFLTFGLLIVYYMVMPYIGFVIAGIFFLGIMFWLLGERSKWRMATLSVVMPVVVYLIFQKLLRVMLP